MTEPNSVAGDGRARRALTIQVLKPFLDVRHSPMERSNLRAVFRTERWSSCWWTVASKRPGVGSEVEIESVCRQFNSCREDGGHMIINQVRHWQHKPTSQKRCHFEDILPAANLQDHAPSDTLVLQVSVCSPFTVRRTSYSGWKARKTYSELSN